MDLRCPLHTLPNPPASSFIMSKFYSYFLKLLKIDNRWVTSITRFITKDVFFILIIMPQLFEILYKINFEIVEPRFSKIKIILFYFFVNWAKKCQKKHVHGRLCVVVLGQSIFIIKPLVCLVTTHPQYYSRLT